ncbi:MAG TPA: dihydrolipoamide acetyltransferase family protein [Roseiflexaceae bacterium]|nr:dihydrolipoamide acetyltransferase family protein [Roseiflexaceae bacterium]
MSIEYQLPELPLGSPEATLIRWLKQPGDRLAPGDPLLVVANDSVEVVFPIAFEGTVDALLAVEGAPVTVGASVARIAAALVVVDKEAGVEGEGPVLGERETPAGPVSASRRATPVARRIAAKAEIDITRIGGSGPGGRISKADVLAYLGNARLGAIDGANRRSSKQADGSGLSTEKDSSILNSQFSALNALSPMRRAIAAHLVRSRATSPHALTAMEVDMGQVAVARACLRDGFARRGIDLTYTACVALAAVEALLRHPLLNSSWSDAGIVLRRRVHLGLAVALPDGLITPVIREAQDLNLRGMARAVADVARRARAGALRPGEASGGTFTVTNPGAGSLWFGTPIIAQPHSAILGVGAVRKRPLVVDEGGIDRIVVRPTALLTLAYDARVLDQYHADAYLRDVKRNLEHFHA